MKWGKECRISNIIESSMEFWQRVGGYRWFRVIFRYKIEDGSESVGY